jgi:hypothetical protein
MGKLLYLIRTFLRIVKSLKTEIEQGKVSYSLESDSRVLANGSIVTPNDTEMQKISEHWITIHYHKYDEYDIFPLKKNEIYTVKRVKRDDLSYVKPKYEVTLDEFRKEYETKYWFIIINLCMLLCINEADPESQPKIIRQLLDELYFKERFLEICRDCDNQHDLTIKGIKRYIKKHLIKGSNSNPKKVNSTTKKVYSTAKKVQGLGLVEAFTRGDVRLNEIPIVPLEIHMNGKRIDLMAIIAGIYGLQPGPLTSVFISKMNSLTNSSYDKTYNILFGINSKMRGGVVQFAAAPAAAAQYGSVYVYAAGVTKAALDAAGLTVLNSGIGALASGGTAEVILVGPAASVAATTTAPVWLPWVAAAAAAGLVGYGLYVYFSDGTSIPVSDLTPGQLQDLQEAIRVEDLEKMKSEEFKRAMKEAENENKADEEFKRAMEEAKKANDADAEAKAKADAEAEAEAKEEFDMAMKEAQEENEAEAKAKAEFDMAMEWGAEANAEDLRMIEYTSGTLDGEYKLEYVPNHPDMGAEWKVEYDNFATIEEAGAGRIGTADSANTDLALLGLGAALFLLVVSKSVRKKKKKEEKAAAAAAAAAAREAAATSADADAEEKKREVKKKEMVDLTQGRQYTPREQAGVSTSQELLHAKKNGGKIPNRQTHKSVRRKRRISRKKKGLLSWQKTFA